MHVRSHRPVLEGRELRTILVALDGSEFAEEALPFAEEIARAQRAKVFLLRVIPPQPLRRAAMQTRPLRRPGTAPTEEAVREAAEYLEAVAARVAARGLEVETGARKGPVVKSIVAVAREISADLVAMATHGRGGLGRAVGTSVASAVLRQVDVPVLLYRGRLPRQGGPGRVRRSGPRG